MRHPMRHWIALVAASVIATGCESGSAAGPTESQNPNAGITVSASASTMTAPRGWNAILDVSVSRTGGFASTVDLTVQGLPAGATAGFTTASLGPNATGARLNVEVDSSTAYGTYPLTIRGSGNGVNAGSVVVSLVVPRPSFSLQISPLVVYTAQTTSLGTTRTLRLDVSAVRSLGFKGPIALQVEGLPEGLTPLSASSSVGTNALTAQVYLVIGSAAVPGTYTVTIRGTATDAEPGTASVSLTVPAP